MDILLASPAATEAQPTLSRGERRQRWFELFLVLSISFGLPLARSFYFLVSPPTSGLEMTTARSLYGIVNEGLCLLLLGYVLSRRNLGLRSLGLQWSKRDVLPSFGITILSGLVYFASALLLQMLQHHLFGSYSHGASGRQYFAHPTVAAIPFALLNPFFEELIVRAYLMSEIKALTGSAMLAIASSVLFQASYHLYYGWLGALVLTFMFSVFASYYARTGRAVPIIFAHTVFDVWGLLRTL